MDTTKASMLAAGRVEPGERGPWRVEPFTVEEKDVIWQMISTSTLTTGRLVPPGDYTRLVHDDRGVVMSDTPDELSDCIVAVYRARGRVLVNGLGLGCVVRGILSKDKVTHVDIIELDEDVIELVGPSVAADPRVTIHHADAFAIEWPAGTRWDVAWHDVWDTLCEDNLSNEEFAVPGTYAALHRKYGRRVGWQGSWGFELVRAMRRRDSSGW